MELVGLTFEWLRYFHNLCCKIHDHLHKFFLFSKRNRDENSLSLFQNVNLPNIDSSRGCLIDRDDFRARLFAVYVRGFR